MLKKTIFIGGLLGIFVLIPTFTHAQFNLCPDGTPPSNQEVTSKEELSPYSSTGNCTFSTGQTGGSTWSCEYCRTVRDCRWTSYNSGSPSCTITNDSPTCSTNTECFWQSGSSGGCQSNSDCPHPPDVVCDTSCVPYNSTSNACQQVDPSCGTGGGGGGGGGSCGDGMCNNGETSSSCPSDCTTTNTPNFTISVSPTTNSALPGEAKYYYLTVTPSNAAAEGTYTFSNPIIGCPAGATCTYSGGNTASTGTDWNVAGDQIVTPAYKTVVVTPTTTTSGTYTLTFSATKNNTNVTKSTTGYLVVNAGVNNSSCFSITPSKTTVTAGEAFTVSVNMNNNGTTVWSPNDTRPDISGVNNYHVLVSPWSGGTGPWGTSRAPITSDISPGSHVVVNIPVTAPSTAGTYNYSTQMIQEGVQWFGAICNGGNITVTSTPVSQPNLTASVVGQSAATTGTALSFTSTISNNGTASTGASFSNFFQIATAANGGGTITDLTATSMSALPVSGADTATSPSYTFTSTGTYSVRACADKNKSASSGTITESNESDNCGTWTTVTVSSPAAPQPPTNPVGSCPSPGTAATVSWTLPAGYTQVLIRAQDSASTGSNLACNGGSNQLCLDGYTGTSYSFTGSSAPAMVAGHTYNWWVHTYNSSTGQYSTAVGGNFTCAAAVTQYSLTVIKPIGGTITTTDGQISCGGTCTRQYNQGSSVTLQAVPDTSYWRFVGWGGACSGQGTGNCTITINGNTSVTAQFRPKSLLYQEF